ncbi:TNF receptor-associated factor 6-like [Haemaphysalis longicornis]
MASAGTQYTVFGFDSRIDWKPTVFVDGLPRHRVCSACSMVSSAIALLPCNHLLCNKCYESRGDGECSRCPLDQDIWKPEDVAWSTFTKDNLLGRKIQCWNWCNGCDLVGPVCEIVDHFGDCQYHAVSCFRCTQSLAYKELAGHLETNCTMPEPSTTSIGHGIPDATFTLFANTIGELRDKLSSLQTCVLESKELISGHVQVARDRITSDMLVAESLQTLDNSLKENMGQSQVGAHKTAEELALIRNSVAAIMSTVRDVETLVNEMKASLGTSCADDTRKTTASCRNLQQKLDGLSTSCAKFEKTGKSIDALQRTLNERANGERVIKDSLKRLNDRLNDEVCMNISVLGETAKLVSGLPLYSCEPLTWEVEKWSDLKNVATADGQVTTCAKNPKFFYGYLILPGIKIDSKDGNLKLFAIYHLCQGGYDSMLNWPFENDVHLNVMNKEVKSIPLCIKQAGKGTAVKGDARPTTEKNDFVTCWRSLNVTDVENNGCVIDDKVTVTFTVSRL